jgi:hypothetical protein
LAGRVLLKIVYLLARQILGVAVLISRKDLAKDERDTGRARPPGEEGIQAPVAALAHGHLILGVSLC